MEEHTGNPSGPRGEGEPAAPPGSAPPVQPDPVAAAEGGGFTSRATGSSWPTVVGIIAMVLAVLDLLCGLWGLLGTALMGDFMRSAMNEAQVAVMERWKWEMLTLNVVANLTALWLLWGAVLLLRRRPRAAGVLRGWALVKIVLGILGLGVGTMVQREQMAAGATPGGPFGPATGAFQSGMMIFSFVIGLVWALTLPIFLLIWLRRPAIKAEIAGWERPSAATDSAEPSPR